MSLFELKIEILLKFPLNFQASLEPLSKLIATAMMNSSFRELHMQKGGFKHFVFSNFLKISKSKIYERGENFFLFRTINKELAFEIMKSLIGLEDRFFVVKSVGVREVRIKKVDWLISLNPVVMSFSNKEKSRYWTIWEDGDIKFLMDALHNNLVRKYEDFYKRKIDADENFIEFLELKNQKPFGMKYKNGKIFGNKFYIVPKQDEISQKLAFLALAEGLGEKNSIGFGFCKGKERVYFKVLKC